MMRRIVLQHSNTFSLGRFLRELFILRDHVKYTICSISFIIDAKGLCLHTRIFVYIEIITLMLYAYIVFETNIHLHSSD